MTFRPATEKDRAEIENLIFGILREHGLEPSPGSTDADLADIEGFYGGGNGFFDVLTDSDERIAGTVAICRTSEGFCELRKMYLSEAFRGRGLGSQLLEHAVDRARKMGFDRMWLETADSLKLAHSLYLRNGFVPFSAPHTSARCDFAMAKEL